MPYHFVVKGDANYAWTVAGDSRQEYYLREGKTQPFSSVSHEGDEGYAWDTSIALGYAFDFVSGDSTSLNFTPLVGYAWREQNLKASNGREHLGGADFNQPASFALENSYKTRWTGPWLGADITLASFKRHEIFSSFQHHWVEYEAEGHWRQSKDVQQPKSFKHDGDATGIVASAGYRYFMGDTWGVSLAVEYQKWEGDGGQETLYPVIGEPIKSKLSELERESFGINMGVNMQF